MKELNWYNVAEVKDFVFDLLMDLRRAEMALNEANNRVDVWYKAWEKSQAELGKKAAKETEEVKTDKAEVAE